MDVSSDGVPRKISAAAVKRYARPPPPIPMDLPLDPAPPVIPPRDRLPPRDIAPIHASSRPPPPPIPRAPPPPVGAAAVNASASTASTSTTTAVVHTVTQQPPASFREVRSLIPRPGSRAHNDYIDHPVKSSSSTSDRTPSSNSSSTAGQQPIFTQPKKDQKDPNLTIDADDNTQHQDSIICSKCGKCKCRDCTQPQDCCTPRWICNRSVECSPDKAVEYCTCLCCVQCIFYHCYDERADDELSARDDPCACCERPACCRRWACMGLMSLCLPCLCCYWPLNCVSSMCKECHHRCSRRGCHCRKDKPQNMKRLLIDSESSSA
jgi:protein sprouty family protein 2